MGSLGGVSCGREDARGWLLAGWTRCGGCALCCALDGGAGVVAMRCAPTLGLLMLRLLYSMRQGWHAAYTVVWRTGYCAVFVFE